jgi:signal transduction histidine kinase
MAWHPTALSLLSFSSALIFAVLASVGYRRREAAGGSFAALMVGGMVWAAAYGVQLGFTTAAEQLALQRIVLAASAAIPPLLLVFAYEYADRRERLTPGVVGVLALEAVSFAALAATNPSHRLVWTEATLSRWSSSPVLDVAFAAGYYVHVAFAYVVVGVALWTLLSVYFRSARAYRKQSGLLLAGAAPAFVAHALFTLSAGPVSGLDLTPFVFAFTGTTYGLALFHFDLLERTPVAHRRAIELTGDGLLVVDGDGWIVDSNRVARTAYGFDRTGETHVSAVAGETDVRRLSGTKREVVDGSRRTYDVYVTELDRGNRRAGFAVVLRDVTDRDAYERRLEVANRVLRHNLRNDMNVILGNADLLAGTSSTEGQRELAEVIRETAEGLVSLSEKAHQIATLQRRTGETSGAVVDVVPVLTELVRALRSTHPSVTVTTAFPDAATAVAVSERALRNAFENVLENAVEHNDTAGLTVDVSVATDESTTRVRVRDSGSGLPQMERDVLENRSETPLRHSSGLGLWLTHWIVSATRGEIVVESPEAGGTAITLVFPNGSAAPSSAARSATERAEGAA